MKEAHHHIEFGDGSSLDVEARLGGHWYIENGFLTFEDDEERLDALANTSYVVSSVFVPYEDDED